LTYPSAKSSKIKTTKTVKVVATELIAEFDANTQKILSCAILERNVKLNQLCQTRGPV